MLKIGSRGDARCLQRIVQLLDSRTRPHRNENATQAERLLTDDTFNDAYGRILSRISDEMLVTDDPEKRQALYLESRALHRIVNELSAIASAPHFEE